MERVVVDCSTGVVEAEPFTSEEVAAREAEVAADAAQAAAHHPLGPAGVAATLNAVLGVWPLADAANAVRLPEQALVNEAMAWAACA